MPGLLTIKEFTSAVGGGMTPRMVRHYHELGLLPQPVRSAEGSSEAIAQQLPPLHSKGRTQITTHRRTEAARVSTQPHPPNTGSGTRRRHNC